MAVPILEEEDDQMDDYDLHNTDPTQINQESTPLVLLEELNMRPHGISLWILIVGAFDILYDAAFYTMHFVHLLYAYKLLNRTSQLDNDHGTQAHNSASGSNTDFRDNTVNLPDKSDDNPGVACQTAPRSFIQLCTMCKEGTEVNSPNQLCTKCQEQSEKSSSLNIQ